MTKAFEGFKVRCDKERAAAYAAEAKDQGRSLSEATRRLWDAELARAARRKKPVK